MMFLESLNMQSLVLMAGSIGDVNSLAAMVLVVSVGEFLLMTPYGLALSAAAFIGNSMGANQPKLSISNTKIFIVFSFAIATLVCGSVIISRSFVMNIYGAKT